MKRICFYLCTFLLVVFMTGCAKDVVEVTGSISGVITDASSRNKTIAGASVTLNPTGLKSTTGSDGRYEFSNLEMGQYTVQVEAQGYHTATMKIDIVAGKKSIGDIQLTSKETSSKLSLNPSSLVFGSSTESLTFSIANTGDKSTTWNISGLEPWLSVTPSSGTIDAGRSKIVKVMVNRDLLTKTTSTSIVINAGDESASLPITVEVGEENALLKLNTSELNFGTEQSELSFQIQNKGNAGTIQWNVAGVDADWLTVSPISGSTAMGKSSTVKVMIDRSKISSDVSTTILIEGNGESLPLRIVAEARASESRYISVYPQTLDFGTDKESEFFIVYSYNGSTDYKLYVEGDNSWIYFSEVEGTIPKYDEDDISTITGIYAYVDRSGLQPGDYSCTIIVRTDVGEERIRVNMTVPSNNENTISGSVTSCDSRIDVKLLSGRRSGTTVTIEFSVTNNGNDIANVDMGCNNQTTYAYDNEGGYYSYGPGDGNSPVYNLKVTFGGSTSTGTVVRKPFPSGATLKAELKFTDVPESVDSFSNITISFKTYASTWKFDNNNIIMKNVTF